MPPIHLRLLRPDARASTLGAIARAGLDGGSAPFERFFASLGAHDREDRLALLDEFLAEPETREELRVALAHIGGRYEEDGCYRPATPAEPLLAITADALRGVAGERAAPDGLWRDALATQARLVHAIDRRSYRTDHHPEHDVVPLVLQHAGRDLDAPLHEPGFALVPAGRRAGLDEIEVGILDAHRAWLFRDPERAMASAMSEVRYMADGGDPLSFCDDGGAWGVGSYTRDRDQDLHDRFAATPRALERLSRAPLVIGLRRDPRREALLISLQAPPVGRTRRTAPFRGRMAAFQAALARDGESVDTLRLPGALLSLEAAQGVAVRRRDQGLPAEARIHADLLRRNAESPGGGG